MKKFIENSYRRYDVSLISFALMPNHYHMVVQTRFRNLSYFMQSVNCKYTIYFNNKYERVGHLWQGRFKSIPILCDAYLETVIKYVEMNPIRAELSETIEAYPFVSNLTAEKYDNDWNSEDVKIWDEIGSQFMN